MIGMLHFPDMTLSLPLIGVPLVYFRSWCRTDRKRALSYGREYFRPVPEFADISTMSGFVARSRGCYERAAKAIACLIMGHAEAATCSPASVSA